MPFRVGQAPPGYTPIPQTGPQASNVVDVSDAHTLTGLLQAFAAATGDADAPLRVVQEGQKVRILVPQSPQSLPSFWTRFKAALSDLPILSRFATLRAARMEVSSVPLDQHPAADVLRNGILLTVRRELDDHAGDDRSQAFDATEGKPLTRRTVEQILQPAVSEVALRARLAQIGATGQSPRAAVSEQRANAARSRPASRLTLEEAVKPLLANRHEALFRYCVELVKAEHDITNLNEIATAARQLHDRVQAIALLQRDQWPIIADVDDFDVSIRPLAAMMAPEHASSSMGGLEGRDAGLLIYCAGFLEKRLDTSDAGQIREAAKNLHDRVRASLVAIRRWPIDASSFDETVKQAVSTLAD